MGHQMNSLWQGPFLDARSVRMKPCLLLPIPLPIPFAFTRANGEESSRPVPRWPQFRGPGGRGVAADKEKYPARFGPDTNMLWKTPLPLGNSSPCLWGDRIFVTGFHKQKQLLE